MGTTIYTIEFTSKFWDSVDNLGLCRSEFTTMSLSLMKNPYQGRDISGRDSNIRAWDISFPEKGDFRWFYMIDENIRIIESVFVIPNDDPSHNTGNDIIFMARLAEIAWRIITNG